MADSIQARALWYIAPDRAELRDSAIERATADEALVRMAFSAVSRGTERLIFSGSVPPSEYARMRAPMQDGDFPYPVKYGYCAVGLVEDGPAELGGKAVFCLHPHQDYFFAPVKALTPLPEGLPLRRATLAANMETALNALWDSGAGPGDRIVIIGAGVVGLLTAYIAAGLPGADVTIIDIDQSRAAIAKQFGAAFASPEMTPANADVVFHASATADGLALALNAAGREASVVEISWHGAGQTPLALGGAFHSQRLRLISSQVGEVSPTRRPRWSHKRRLVKALALLADDRLDALLSPDIEFCDLPAALPQLFSSDATALTAIVRY